MNKIDEDDDDFQDAAERITMDLETSIEHAFQAINLFLNNDFESSRRLLERWSNTSMYHSLGVSVLNFIEALLTFDQTYIHRATESLDRTVDICTDKKYKSKLKDIISRVSYNDYSPEQVHAELCYAESLLLRSMLYFIEDENFYSFIKAMMKVRNSFNSYKECSEIRKVYKWDNEVTGKNFESGVHMGVGLFNLMLSILPRKIIKLLEFIGFSASREVGFKELEDGIKLEGTIRNVLCTMSMLNYHLMVTPAMTHRLGNNELCQQLLDRSLKVYPNGMLFLLFKGRLEFMKGNFDESQRWYMKAWKSQDQWPQFNHICFWELLWLNLVRHNYENALEWADRLVEGSKWSRTIYFYIKGCLMSALKKKKNDVDETMEAVPNFKKMMAGKSVPTEKLVIRKAQRFKEQNSWLCLPLIELLHVYNMFKVMATSVVILQSTLNMIERELKVIPEVGGPFQVDNECLALFLKGCCLSRLNSPLQAEECFMKVIKQEKNIKEDEHLPPFAYVELAMMKADLGLNDEAAQYLETARRKYSNYVLENKLNVRIHSVNSQIFENTE